MQAEWSLAEDRLYTIKESAQLLARSDRYVRDLIRTGKIIGFSLNRKGWSHLSGRSINKFLKGVSSAGE